MSCGLTRADREEVSYVELVLFTEPVASSRNTTVVPQVSGMAERSRWQDLPVDRTAYAVAIYALSAGILLGFGLDLAYYLAERPQLASLHAHAALAVVWLALVNSQVALVQGRYMRLHRQLGWATAVVSVFMVPMAAWAAVSDAARALRAGHHGTAVLAFELCEILSFALFTSLGLWLRRDRAVHRRLMTLAVLAVSGAGLGRVWFMSTSFRIHSPAGVWLELNVGGALLALALMGYELARHRRIHPALLAGLVWLFGSQAVATIAYGSSGWVALVERSLVLWQ